MATFTGARAARAVPPVGAGYGGHPVFVRGYINITANPADGDIYELCRTPAKFLCWGGVWRIADLDTGTEALDADLGWAANGGAATDTHRGMDGTEWTDVGYQADPDGLVNSGVLSGDGVTDVFAAGVNVRPIILAQPLFFNRSTIIQAEANVAAATFAAGYMAVELQGEIIG